MEKVEIFVIGAEKAGTTYLAQMLSAQHFISGAKTKELHYFNEINGRGRGIPIAKNQSLGITHFLIKGHK